MEMRLWYEAEPSVADADRSEIWWLGKNLHDGLLFEIWNVMFWLTTLLFELARTGSEDKATWTGFPDEVAIKKPIFDFILANGELELDWTEIVGTAESDEPSWHDTSLPADAEKM